MTQIASHFLYALQTSFWDQNIPSEHTYQTRLLRNHPQADENVYSSLITELRHCHGFDISVAFITASGVQPFLPIFSDLQERKIPGRIITSDYLCFTDPQALRMLKQFKNIELRFFLTSQANQGFHTKGYVFAHQHDMRHIILGSSNWTGNALYTNQEWNTFIVLHKNGSFHQELFDAYRDLWHHRASRPIDRVLDTYRQIYRQNKANKKRSAPISMMPSVIQPNQMQKEFLRNLTNIRKEGKSRALLVSATGTGKTFASAFAAKELQFKKILFLTHREDLIYQAKESFQKIFGQRRSYGIMGLGQYDTTEDIIFSTVQTISKEKYLHLFSRDHFDFIIVDEAHRSPSVSYNNIMNYFQAFYLGMTATPDRNTTKEKNSDTNNIFKNFDYNLAHYITLKEALESQLVCPFHYYALYNPRCQSREEKYDFIAKKIRLYGFSGSRRKGLIFCVNEQQALLTENALRTRGFRVQMVTANSSDAKQRKEYVQRLTQESEINALDFLIVIDLFNEGIDIPELNLIVILRQTRSPILYTQQIGRGLRLCPEEKEYTVILDFFESNVTNNRQHFFNVISLNSQNIQDDTDLKVQVNAGNQSIPGQSTIHFEKPTQKLLLSQLKKSSPFQQKEDFESEIDRIQSIVGHVPTLKEFCLYAPFSPLSILKKLGKKGKNSPWYETSKSFAGFLSRHTRLGAQERAKRIAYTEEVGDFLEFLFLNIGQGKFQLEIAFLAACIQAWNLQISVWDCLPHFYTKPISNLQKNFLLQFFSGHWRSKDLENPPFGMITQEGDLDPIWSQWMSHPIFYQDVVEILECARYIQQLHYSELYKNSTFVLNHKYSRYRVLRGLHWSNSPVMSTASSYGTHGLKNNKTNGQYTGEDVIYQFVYYNKGKQKDFLYEDRFIHPQKLICVSKHNRKITSSELRYMLHLHPDEKPEIKSTDFTKNRDFSQYKTYLFMNYEKESDREGNEFYFLGQVTPDKRVHVGHSASDKPTYEITYHLDVPVRQDIYKYLTTPGLTHKNFQAKDSRKNF